MKLEGKCNLRRPTKGGGGERKIKPSRLPALPRNILLSPPAGLLSPPLQRRGPGLGAGAAPHVTGVPGGWGGPQGGPAGGREDGREGRGAASAAAELWPAEPALPSSLLPRRACFSLE